MEERSKIPTFHSIQEEAEFWDTHSPLDYLDELEPVEATFAPDAFEKTDESTRVLTVELPESTVRALQTLAGSRGIDPTALIRGWIFERLRDIDNLPPSAAG